MLSVIVNLEMYINVLKRELNNNELRNEFTGMTSEYFLCRGSVAQLYGIIGELKGA